MERVRRDNNEIEINLADIFQILLSKWIYILIAGLIGGILVGTFTRFFIKKKYTAYTSMYIYTSNTDSQQQTGTITSSELAAADNLIKTYQVIVKSNSVLDVIAENFNAEHPEYAEYGITTDTLGKLCSVSVPTNTKLIEVDVRTTDPILSATIANTFAKYAPEQIVRITKAGGVEIVDWATVPKSASSPNLTRNIAIGVLGGLMLAAAFFILKTYLDTTIYTSEEVHKVSQCPVIGTVPMIIIGNEEITPWNVTLREEITNG